MNWISYLKKFLIRNLHLADTSSKSEGIILSSKKIGTRKEGMIDIELLLQISPPKGRNYLLEHTDTFSNDEFHKFLQPGQRIYLSHNPKTLCPELTWTENENRK